MKKKKLRNLEIALIILLFVMLFWNGVLYYKNSDLKEDKEYYMSSMISFCKMTMIQQSSLVNIYGEEWNIMKEDCDYWLLPWDKEIK